MYPWDLSWGSYDSVVATEAVLSDDLTIPTVRKRSHKRTVSDGDDERAGVDLFI